MTCFDGWWSLMQPSIYGCLILFISFLLWRVGVFDIVLWHLSVTTVLVRVWVWFSRRKYYFYFFNIKYDFLIFFISDFFSVGKSWSIVFFAGVKLVLSFLGGEWLLTRILAETIYLQYVKPVGFACEMWSAF